MKNKESASRLFEAGRPIVQAVLQLARGLGLSVVAEGVETGQIGSRLREMGCDLAQGYFFGRPGCADNISLFKDNPSEEE